MSNAASNNDRQITMTDLHLAVIHDGLVQIRDAYQDCNSAMPETKAYLEARGLTNVRQLDKQGLADLTAHLERVAEELTAKNNAAGTTDT